MLDALALAIMLAAEPPQPPLQVLAGPAFERLLRGVEARCPTSQVRYASPAALLDTEDGFAEHLPRRTLLRLQKATPADADGPLACADSPGGASCPAGATLGGIQRAGLEPRFVRFVCARGGGAWN